MAPGAACSAGCSASFHLGLCRAAPPHLASGPPHKLWLHVAQLLYPGLVEGQHLAHYSGSARALVCDENLCNRTFSARVQVMGEATVREFSGLRHDSTPRGLLYLIEEELGIPSYRSHLVVRGKSLTGGPADATFGYFLRHRTAGSRRIRLVAREGGAQVRSVLHWVYTPSS